MIHHRQCARKSQTNRTSVRIRFGSNFNRTRAKHLRVGLELHVHFKPNAGDVFHLPKFLTQWPQRSQRNIRSSFSTQTAIHYTFNPVLEVRFAEIDEKAKL